MPSYIDLGFDSFGEKRLDFGSNSDYGEDIDISGTLGQSGLSAVNGLPDGSIDFEKLTVNTLQARQYISFGKTLFDNTQSGGILGFDADTAKFYLGDTTNYVNWTGTALNIAGSLTASTIDIGGSDATSFHVDINGNMWLGAATLATAPFSVTNAGAATASAITITGGSIAGVPISNIPNSTVTDISLLDCTHDLVFSVTDKDTVAWAAGTISFSNGRTFSIDAGNTGNMAARTYIYLDDDVSHTVLQTTTSVSTAMGAKKKLIAWAQNGVAQAIFMVYGGYGGFHLPSSSTSISNNNWLFSGVWTVTDADTIAWGNGTLTVSDGNSYSITGSNTGNMSAKTYIYFDLAVSSTAFQLTTTAANSVGEGKILIAVAQNGTGEASFIVMNDQSSNITAAQIVAGSITANEIATGTITADRMNVSQLSAIAADLGAITAGSIVLPSGGFIRSGQTAYDTGIGFYLGNDSSVPVFSIGNSAGYKLTWNGTTLTVTGTITGSSITAIPNDTATDISILEATHDLVFSVTDKDTVAWTAGTITLSNGRTFTISAGNTGDMAARTYIYLSPADSSTALQTTTTVSTAMGANKKLIAWAQNGVAQATFAVYGGYGGLHLPATGTSISNNNWYFSGTWSVTDLDTVAWGNGTLTVSDGNSYSITGSNTGNMSAKTYIYFDLSVSPTAFQTTTTAANSVGEGKILIAVAQNGTAEASFIVMNDPQSNINAANIVAGSITANEIATGTITADRLTVSQLSAISADMGAITAGSIGAGTATIGGWSITATTIQDTGGTVGLSSAVTAGDDIRFWAGHATPASAPFRVTEAGAVTASSITITGGSISGVPISGIPNSTVTDISLLEATHDLVFSVTDKDTVAWASGTITMSNGRTFSIDAGNTGNMAARTYIYLDPAISSTVLQTTTTVSTAIGANKKLIAVAQNGAAQAQFIVYGGIGGLKLPASGTSISNNNWTFSGTWSVTDADTVAWGAGTLTTSDGGSYAIDAGNTGNMSAKTYIYFDLGTSAVILQTTTTAATSIGDGKILMAIAQNGTAEASYMVMNDFQKNINAAQIVAGSITTNEIATGTITAGNMNVSQLSAISADMGAITAGTIAVVGGGNTVSFTPGAATAITSGPTGAPTFTVTSAGVMSCTGATVNGSSLALQDVYGDGSGGDVTLAIETTLTSDMFYDDLNINGQTLNTGGYRIFVKGILSGTGTIRNNGGVGGGGGNGEGAGGTGTNAAAGAAGTQAPGNTVPPGQPGEAGGMGGSGQVGNGGNGGIGTAGDNAVKALNNNNGKIGALGGNGQDGSGIETGGVSNGAGAAGTVSGTILNKINNFISFYYLSDHIGSWTNFSVTAGSGSGGGGGGAGGSTWPERGAGGGGGGGSGGTGGIVWISAKNITFTGAIEAKGGNGGNGGNGGSASASPGQAGRGGGGGAGSGGNGGIILIATSSASASYSSSAVGGNAGTKGVKGTLAGTGTPDATDGLDGTAGAAGSVITLII